METLAERNSRIQRLEQSRASRSAESMGVWPTPDSSGVGSIPIEIGPGRGDLNFTSGFAPTIPTSLQLIGHHTVSFARLFMSQPWVAAAVMRMLTWGVRVPLKVYRRTGTDDNDRKRLRAGEHPLATAIEEPWHHGSQASLLQAMLGPVLVHGNSVIEIDNPNADKLGFTAKDWRFCRPIMPFRDSLEGFTFDVDSPEFRHEVAIDSVLYTAWWSPIAPIGCSPLQQLGVTLQIEDAAQRYQRSIFANGARPPSAITSSDDFLGLDRVERQQVMAQLRADLTVLYSGPENAGKPALLPPGLDWKAIGQTTVEAELIAQRKITREEIAGVYLIPPPLIGILDKATFSNISVQRDMTYTDCLGPPLILIEQAINAQVARDLLQEDDVFCEFDFGAVLRGDRLEEIDALRGAVSTGLMTPNEGRGVLALPHSNDDGMDDFYMPLVNNLAPVGTPQQEANAPADVPVPPDPNFLETPDPNAPKPADPATPVDPAPVPPTSRSGGRRLHVRTSDADYEKVV